MLVCALGVKSRLLCNWSFAPQVIGCLRSRRPQLQRFACFSTVCAEVCYCSVRLRELQHSRQWWGLSHATIEWMLVNWCNVNEKTHKIHQGCSRLMCVANRDKRSGGVAQIRISSSSAFVILYYVTVMVACNISLQHSCTIQVTGSLQHTCHM